jgi:tRNA wybutosine-synthesizing protein 1
MFMKTQHPVSGAEEWEKIQKTLKLFPTFNTRRVIRLTLVKNLNMLDAENYAALIKIAQPHFIEAKAWMAIGQSRSRLPIESMPKHAEIREFSEKLAKALPDYEIKDESPVSRIVLLAHRALKPPPLYK